MISEGCPSYQVSAATMTSASNEKWRTFTCFFQSREQVVVQRTQIRRIWWWSRQSSPGSPVSSGLQVSGESGHCRARNRPPLVTFPAAFSLQNVLLLHRQRLVILRVDSMALWKIINGEDAVLIPKIRGQNFSSGFLHSEFFGARWAVMLPLHWLLLCLRVVVI